MRQGIHDVSTYILQIILNYASCSCFTEPYNETSCWAQHKASYMFAPYTLFLSKSLPQSVPLRYVPSHFIELAVENYLYHRPSFSFSLPFFFFHLWSPVIYSICPSVVTHILATCPAQSHFIFLYLCTTFMLSFHSFFIFSIGILSINFIFNRPSLYPIQHY